MDETQLILNALHGEAPVKEKKFVPVGLDLDLDIPPPSEVAAWNKSLHKLVKKPRKVKGIKDWSNADFLRYLSDLLKNQGTTLESNIRDKETVGRIYDSLAKRLRDVMSNEILREYFDWWVSSHGVILKSHVVFPYMLLNDKYLDTFVNRFAAIPAPVEEQPVQAEAAVDADTLYSLGGIQMLLMSQGIVVAFKTMTNKKEVNVFQKISDCLRAMPKNSLVQVVNLTIKKAPYSKSDIVDFISLSKRALEYNGIKDFAKVNYSVYFK